MMRRNSGTGLLDLLGGDLVVRVIGEGVLLCGHIGPEAWMSVSEG